jgi:hypothetical protein
VGAANPGAWFAGIGKRGDDLVAAGRLMLAGLVDLDELDWWMRVGWERRRGATVPYSLGDTEGGAAPLQAR